MESTGARLKKIRLEKGYSLEDVHKGTKIHYNVLKAIEEDSLVNFNPVYIKGFLKIYCVFLGVNPEEYISHYKKAKAHAVVIEQKESPSLPALKKPLVRDDLLKAVRKIKIVITAVIIIGAAIVLFRMAGAVVLRLSLMFKKIKSGSSAQAVGRVYKQRKIEKRQEAKDDGRQKIPVSTLIKLTVRTREDCWLQIKVDGKTAFQNILKKGRYESWQAKEKIEFSLGNAGAVDLEVNGRLISNLGRRRQAVKNILITRDGLTVPR